REMIQALVLGEKGMLPADIKADFSRLGISHLLAISGLHMGIVTWLAYALIMAGLKCYPRILLYLDGWKWAAVLAVIPAVLYGFVAGFQLPTVRALLMICAYVSALLLGRGHNLVNALMLAALVILLVLPASLFEASFQLSFAAVFCLVVVMPSLQQRVVSQRTSVAAQPGDMLERVRWCLLTSLIASAVVTIGTAPVVAACFHRISLVGVVVNMVMVPYVGLLVVPLCLVATAAVPLNAAVADLLFSGAGIFTELILNATAVWAGAAWAEITVMRPKLWEVGALYGLLLAVPVVLRRRKLKWYAAAVACFIMLECGQAWWPRSPAGNLRVTFLDVGNGDAAVVEFPSGAVMLIDGGGFMDESFDIGRAVIAPFLYYNRLARVDYVVASHGHADHIGGLASVIDEFGIAEVWVNSAQVSTPLQRRLREVVRSRGGRVKVMGDGLTTLAVEGVRIMVFGADAADVSGTDHAHENNKSLVMKIIWGETSFLFTGDVHIARENDLLLRNAPLGATVLKVPHHGRAGSSSKGFIRRVSPQVAVVSVRGNGSRNIPSAAVLQDYTALGARVYRTDIQGAVSIESDGISFQVVPYLPTNY
ncbi:MAG: DNA internalization-related competence protein ComEC/Rec2, partial [Deltaproteobacteria bacterium]|nr:DNA internalization-related competence protein ComEC/Rec2 [Deltaproteobacteria bacterium]